MAGAAPFSWHNATVYFVLIDRFVNDDPSNDHSYGRQRDGMQEIGTFHGGDLAGVSAKLDYLQQLGVNALWLISPLEQIHGWVGGGTKGNFPHYAYHGYYTQDWIRTDIGDYDAPGYDDLTMSLAFLPDIKTESRAPSGLPVFYQHKPDTGAVAVAGYAPRDYLTLWLSRWVRDFGIDGFRVDTARHVELAAWQQLKQQAQAALSARKTEHPQQALDAAPFWMVGESWGHGLARSDYYQSGFDAMLNFSYQDQASEALSCFSAIDDTWRQMARHLQDYTVLSYLSSHDTRLFFHDDARGDNDRQRLAGNLLLLAPGTVQIFYGDESGRERGPAGSDPLQGTRSDMNWAQLTGEKGAILRHWQRLGRFRARHPAIGNGLHRSFIAPNYYAFSRTQEGDRVLVVWRGEAAESK